MIGIKVLIVVAFCLSWSQCKQDKYCSLCQSHTMCKYHGFSKECKDVGEGGVTEKEKRDIVDLHNWMRSLVATGHETRGVGGSQAKAANMMKMVWDDEVQKVAQRWADQCTFQHDTCRNDPRWNVGQNLFWKWKYPTNTVNWTEAIFSWYDEVALYNPSEVNKYRFESSTGHYTQLIWHDTYALGCGRRNYGLNIIYVCNYGPAGNWIGEPLYDVGDPCTKCPEGTTCDGALCAYSPAKVDPKPEISAVQKREPAPEGLDLRGFNASVPLPIFKELVKDNCKGDCEKEKLHKCTCPQDNLKHNFNDLLSDTEKQIKSMKKTLDKVERNEIELDGDLKKEIEELKRQIDNLVKDIIKKNKNPLPVLQSGRGNVI